MKHRKIPHRVCPLPAASFSMIRAAISGRWPLVLAVLAALYVLMIASRSLSIWYHGIGPYMRPTFLHYRGKGGHYVGKVCLFEFSACVVRFLSQFALNRLPLRIP
jgi:hypothetical protein